MKTMTPVSPVCPNCGGRDYTKVPAAVKGSLTRDRSCNRCSTRYAPPTPFWVVGVVPAVILALPGYVLLTAQNSGDVRGAMWLGFGLSTPVLGLLIRAIRDRQRPS